jgi:hypothetical protein
MTSRPNAGAAHDATSTSASAPALERHVVRSDLMNIRFSSGVASWPDTLAGRAVSGCWPAAAASPTERRFFAVVVHGRYGKKRAVMADSQKQSDVSIVVE